jgi:isoquinoline 1-oxidoreductase beta subunit
VEVSLREGKIKVEKVVCTADCGLVINPIGADAQVQGGITDAISAALYESISLNDGALVEQNFHQYQKLRIGESPAVEVHFVPSNEKPIGLGEPSYPVLFPALVNAASRATGQRIRQLPLKKHGLA